MKKNMLYLFGVRVARRLSNRSCRTTLTLAKHKESVRTAQHSREYSHMTSCGCDRIPTMANRKKDSIRHSMASLYDALQVRQKPAEKPGADVCCRLNFVHRWTRRSSRPLSQIWTPARPRHCLTKSAHSARRSKNSQTKHQHSTSMNSRTNSTRPTSPPSAALQTTPPVAPISMAKPPGLPPPPIRLPSHFNHSAHPWVSCMPHCRTYHSHVLGARLAKREGGTMAMWIWNLSWKQYCLANSSVSSKSEG